MNASPRRRAAVAAAALAGGALVLVAACSESGPSIAEWTASADAICEQHQQEADQARPVLYQPTLAQTLRRNAEASAAEAQELRALDKPRDERAQVRDYLGALDDRTAELRRLAEAAEHPGTDFEAPSTESLAAATQKAADLARSLRLANCGAGIDVSVGGATTTTAVPDGLDPARPSDTDLKNWETQDQG